MAAVTQSRALAGSRMFMQAKQTVAVTNGSKYFMRRRDSYMVEVCVGEQREATLASLAQIQ